jgi:hypothetical protein
MGQKVLISLPKVNGKMEPLTIESLKEDSLYIISKEELVSGTPYTATYKIIRKKNILKIECMFVSSHSSNTHTFNIMLDSVNGVLVPQKKNSVIFYSL